MTSFSVSAAEFVPMAMRAPQHTSTQDPISMFNTQMNTAQLQPAAHGHNEPGTGLSSSAQPQPVFCGTKATVCTPFFRQGACSDPACRFAHSLSELDFSAQQQLIAMAGGEEFLPIHFTQSLFHANSLQPQRGLFSASGPTTPSNLGAPRGVVGAAMAGRMTGTPSNGTPSAGGVGSGSSAAGWEDVRVTLPPRCHYPHAIGGTYYDYLNVKRYCSPKDIEASYRSWRVTGYKAAKAIDQSKADAMDRLVVEARLVLGNPTMRVEYDALLPLEEGAMLPPASRLNDDENIW